MNNKSEEPERHFNWLNYVWIFLLLLNYHLIIIIFTHYDHFYTVWLFLQNSRGAASQKAKIIGFFLQISITGKVLYFKIVTFFPKIISFLPKVIAFIKVVSSEKLCHKLKKSNILSQNKMKDKIECAHNSHFTQGMI